MKQLLFLSAFIVLFVSVSPVFAQNDKFIEDYLERLENSKTYLTAVAELMPEQLYDYKASDESLSFAQNLLHIGFAMDWHSQSLLGGREARTWQSDTIYKEANKTKADMIDLIEKTFDAAITTIKEFDTSKLNDELDYFGLTRSKRQILMLLSDHITHHRGQMLVYLRLNGITPPRYVIYQ